MQFVDQQVRVKCLGGRELRGALRGYDELVNLVLDDCEEFIRGETTAQMLGTHINQTDLCFATHFLDKDDPEKITNRSRKLGLVVIRGTQVSLVSPEEGTEEIANPFLGGGDDDEEEES
jgi:U6 snRNA-associated Sm-like protein LSm7